MIQFVHSYYFAANFPPNITVDGSSNATYVLNIKLGDSVEIDVDAGDINGDTVTFGLENPIQNGSIDRE